MKYLIIKSLFHNMKNCFKKINKILKTEIDPAYIDRAEIILNNICNVKIKNILEIGCGRGYYLKALQQIDSSLKITGIDLNEKYLIEAKKYIRNDNVKVIKGDANKLLFKDNSIDAIIASEILEHVPNDNKVLDEIYRVLKKEGRAMISVPNQDYPFLWDPINWLLEKIFGTHMPVNIWWLAGIWAGHLRLYKEDEIVKKIENSGLIVEKVWRTTKYCLPFSHFLFYGIGKNIVENGALKDFNRFENDKKEGLLFRIIKKIILWGDVGNEKKFEKGESTTNIVIRARKK